MNRIGHASRLKRAMNWTVPIVTVAGETRHEPMARSSDVPRAGSASSAGSNPARMYPACTRSSPKRPRLYGEALGLGCLAPEGLDDHRAVDALVRDRGDLADALLGAPRRPLHPSREAPVHEGQAREEQDADQRQERIGRDDEIIANTTRKITPQANGTG